MSSSLSEDAYMAQARELRRTELEEAKQLKDEGCIDSPQQKEMRQDAVARYKKTTEDWDRRFAERHSTPASAAPQVSREEGSTRKKRVSPEMDDPSVGRKRCQNTAPNRPETMAAVGVMMKVR